jgi:plastocyanin
MSKRSLIIIILVIIEVVLIGGAYTLGTRLKESPTQKEPENLAEKVKGTAIVNVTSGGFKPDTITVKKGTLVTFTNKDSKQHRVASDPHPTHTKLASFDSPNLKKGEKYFFLFDKAGTFTYHDHLNPLKFNGTVIVK